MSDPWKSRRYSRRFLDKNLSLKTYLNHEVRNDVKSIHNLSDEILGKIFGMLSLYDRLLVTKVCEHWNNVCLKTWKRSSCRKLESPPKGVALHDVLNILRLSGRYLIHIDFSQYNEIINDEFLYYISRYCEKVQIMDLSSIKLSPIGLNYLDTMFKELTQFKFGSCVKNYNHSLSDLFKSNNKMKSLKIESITTNFAFLTESPISHTLEELVLDDIDSNFTYICRAAYKYKNLKTFSIKDCDNASEKILEAIATYWKNLENLKLSGNFNKIRNLDKICNLTNIQSLDVSFNKLVDDSFLKQLVIGCPQLSDLNVSQCSSITENGLKSISTLENLKYLNINYLKQIKEFNFMKMHNLEILKCSSCTNLTCEQICNVLLGSLKLKALDISYCKKLTGSILDVIEMLTDIRESKDLEINVYGTSIVHYRSKILPNVKLIMEDNTEGEFTIDILNEECIKHIFSFLPLTDKLNATAVCRQWNQMSNRFLSNMTELSPANVYQDKITYDELNKVLNYCGQRLHFVDFSLFNYASAQDLFIHLIGKKCTNLQSISMVDFHLTFFKAEQFLKLENLTSITIGAKNKFSLRYALSHLRCLKHITYVRCDAADSLSSLPSDTLESLNFQYCGDIYNTAESIPEFKNLKSLSITNSGNPTRFSQTLFLNSPSISSLRLCNNESAVTVRMMPNLRSLDVSKSNDFNDNNLQTICERCITLTELNIGGCLFLSNDGFSHLSKLRNLEHLKMDDLTQIKYPVIKNLYKLKVLNCRNCPNLFNAGLCFLSLIGMCIKDFLANFVPDFETTTCSILIRRERR